MSTEEKASNLDDGNDKDIDIPIKGIEKGVVDSPVDNPIDKPTEESATNVDIEPLDPEDQEDTEEYKSDTKSILIIVAVVIGIFALIFLFGKFFGVGTTGAAVVDIDNLHGKNLQGDLNKDEGYIYNGFSFVKVDGLWWTEINRNGETLLKVPLHFGPKEVKHISFSGQIGPDFNKGSEIYIAIDPTIADPHYSLALSELSFNVAKGIDRIPVGACTKENDACVNRTIISCENNPGKPVVELFLSSKTEIALSDSCIKISGEGYELVKSVDRLLYTWYGIMK